MIGAKGRGGIWEEEGARIECISPRIFGLGRADARGHCSPQIECALWRGVTQSMCGPAVSMLARRRRRRRRLTKRSTEWVMLISVVISDSMERSVKS